MADVLDQAKGGMMARLAVLVAVPGMSVLKMGVTSGDPNERVRGRVWKGVGITWHMSVLVGDDVVAYDNTGDWRGILQACLETIPGVRRLVRSGARIPLYEWD